MRESMHQKRFARWNQSSRRKSLFADRRTRPFGQRRAGGVRCQDCNNQRKANRARWLRATSSRRNSEVVSVATNMFVVPSVGPTANFYNTKIVGAYGARTHILWLSNCQQNCQQRAVKEPARVA